MENETIEEKSEIEDIPDPTPTHPAPPPPIAPPPPPPQPNSPLVLTIFQRARQCRPSVKMKRMNWKKVSCIYIKTIWYLCFCRSLRE